jgi:hypothetical protein
MHSGYDTVHSWSGIGQRHAEDWWSRCSRPGGQGIGVIPVVAGVAADACMSAL